MGSFSRTRNYLPVHYYYFCYLELPIEMSLGFGWCKQINSQLNQRTKLLFQILATDSKLFRTKLISLSKIALSKKVVMHTNIVCKNRKNYGI